MREDRRKREALRDKEMKQTEEQERQQKEQEVYTCIYNVCQCCRISVYI